MTLVQLNSIPTSWVGLVFRDTMDLVGFEISQLDKIEMSWRKRKRPKTQPYFILANNSLHLTLLNVLVKYQIVLACTDYFLLVQNHTW